MFDVLSKPYNNSFTTIIFCIIETIVKCLPPDSQEGVSLHQQMRLDVFEAVAVVAKDSGEAALPDLVELVWGGGGGIM